MTDKQAITENVPKKKRLTRWTVTKISLIVSAVILIVSCIVSAASTVAWITHAPPQTINTFLVGDMELEVAHKVQLSDGTTEYQPVDASVKLFADDALFEPGYIEVVYLRIRNTGKMDFDYRLSVTVDDVRIGVNADGDPIYLPDYLKFGAVWGETEADLDRQLSMETATQRLGTYTETSFLDAAPGKSTEYVALIVYMPREVGNNANYTGTDVPTVFLGVTVNAAQKGTLE